KSPIDPLVYSLALDLPRSLNSISPFTVRVMQ
ncbi:MAG: hypothetical protein ACI9JZ_002832, partial [Lentimonas sp.]